ncbi:AMP-binding protein, partial [bacterium]|nr:AMP-binding protein [candidate division CSSED10-310 bacterium]
MYNIGSYTEKRKSFDWSVAKKELGLENSSTWNIGELCSDRICRLGNGSKVAMYWEGHGGKTAEFTFDDLRIHSNGFAHLIREKLGIDPGERIYIFMDKMPELYFSFLGILKAGCIVAPLFSAFQEDSLFTRLSNGGATAVVTTPKFVKRIRKILPKLPHLKHVIVTNDLTGYQPREGEITHQIEDLRIETFDVFQASPETPSVLHYTSGTTGTPKGAQHVHESVLSQYLTTKWILDVRPDDIYWCTADPGWVTGTSYGIIGPWSNGVTQVVFEAGFRSRAWYEILQKYGVTVWYSAPTAIRMLMRDGADLVKEFDLNKLRHLCSVGEPLNAEAVIWSEKVFGKPFHDTWWQTETGSIMIANYPGIKIKPGSMGKPFPGIEAAVLSPKNHSVMGTDETGLLALKPGWPSMFRTYWKNPFVYQEKFKNNFYLTGDRARIDQEGYFWFVGRDDDVINTGGHLVSPFEIESALLEHEAVAESAAIGKPDEINMEVVKAFVALKPGFEPSDDLSLSIMNFIRKKLS